MKLQKKKINYNLEKAFELDWHDNNVFLSYLLHRIKFWNLRWNFFYRKNYTPNKNDFQYEKFKEIFTTAKERVEKNGSKFIFVYQPTRSRYEKKIINHDEYLNKSRIIEIVKNLSIPVIDIHEQFIKHTSPLDLYDGHTNEEGYRKAAEYIFEKLDY